MRKRTRSREFALQVLYQIDVGGADTSEALADFWKDRGDVALTEPERDSIETDKNDDEVRSYAETLVRGTLKNLGEIDRTIEKYAENWEIRRMAYVDRNILRLSTYEMRFTEGLPVKVAINEAVELAKRYGEPDSSKFVNGILDKIAKNAGA